MENSYLQSHNSSTSDDMAPKMALLHRKSFRVRSLHSRMSKMETVGEDEVYPVEISVPSMNDEISNGLPSPGVRQITRSRRIRISPSGKCTTMNEDGKPECGLDVAEKGVDVQRRTDQLVTGGQFKGSLENMITDAFEWLMRQSKGKHIKASKDVLTMYHDLFLYGEVPLTIKVRTALRGWPLRPYLMWTEFFAAITSVILYVLSTYQDGPENSWQRVVQLVCGLFFVVDYILNVYSAPVRLYYIFSFTGLVDFVSTLPIILFWSPGKESSAAILLFLRVLRIIPVITKVGGLTGGAIKEQIFILVISTFGVVFIAAGVLQWVDNLATSQSVRNEKGCGDHGCLTFFDAFWFMIVTMSTVGFGDITPNSDWGRAVILCVIIGALVTLPSQINRILGLASRRPYGGAFAVRKVVGSRFIIISGNLSYQTVQDFLSEFYHPTHCKDMSAFPLRIVIMAPFKPSFELKTLLMHYKHSVEFIQGTPVKDSDLDRVSAKIASAFYLLADHQAKDPDAEDAAQIVRTLSVHRHCGSKVRVIVELLKPEKVVSAIWDDTENGIEIICLDTVRFKLLARSCHIKGLSTFIVNLFRSGLNISKPLKGHWLMQYLHGLRQEVFPVILPDVFHQQGLTFEQVAELVYCKYDVILFAIDIAHEEEGELFREVLLYPKGRVILASDVGLAVAKDLSTAEKVSKFDIGQSHMHCLSLRKFLCVICIKAGLSKKASHRDDCGLLESVKKTRHVEPENEGLDYKHEHKVSMSATVQGVKVVEGVNEIVPEASKTLKTGSPATKVVLPNASQKADSDVNQYHGSVSHDFSLKGDKDGQLHVGRRKLGITLPASIGKDKSQEMSTYLQVQEKLQKLDTMDTPMTPRRLMMSLEDAINIAMSWPPLQRFDKPDPSILERRAPEILENLQLRMMNVVRLHLPHILVCIQGKWPTSLFYFISHLRTPSLPNPPVVILHPDEPSSADWGCVGFFDHVYFVKGSPSYELDLLRAGILQAEKVVILTQGIQLDQPREEIANDQDRLTPALTSFTLDVNNVLVAATVERLLQPLKERVIVELQQEVEIQYLQPRILFDRRIFDSQMYKRNRSATYQFAPPYVDGKAFCPAALGFLMYATFYNRQTLAIVEQLISGGQVLKMDDQSDSELNSDDLVRQLDQVPVPTYYVGKTFKELFIGMLRNHSSLAMGLYRTTKPDRSGVAFVYTNPIPTDVLEAMDLVYILH